MFDVGLMLVCFFVELFVLDTFGTPNRPGTTGTPTYTLRNLPPNDLGFDVTVTMHNGHVTSVDLCDTAPGPRLTLPSGHR